MTESDQTFKDLERVRDLLGEAAPLLRQASDAAINSGSFAGLGLAMTAGEVEMAYYRLAQLLARPEEAE